MSDLTDKLWPSFQAEVSEQLEAIELALLGNHTTNIDVNALFRYFHTIKGGCAMMGFHSMEEIAHAAEDLLDPVRKEESTLDSARITVLLQALDGLKGQLDQIQSHRSDPLPNPELVNALRGFSAQSAPTTLDATTPVMPQAAEPLSAGMQNFADTCRAILPMLMLAPSAPEHQLTLQQAAMENNLGAIVSMLSRPAAHATDAVLRQHFLAELLDRLNWLEQSCHVDCGVADTALLLRAELYPLLQDTTQDAIASVAQLGNANDSESFASYARETGLISERLLSLALLMQQPATTALMRLVRQILREIHRRQPLPDSLLQEHLSNALHMPLNLAAGDPESGAYQNLCETLHQQLQSRSVNVDGRQHSTQLVNQIREQIQLPEALLSTLASKPLQRLAEAVSQNLNVVSIVADLESQADNGEGFLTWLDKNGTLINSETVLDNHYGSSTSRIRFLIASPFSVREIQISLDELDPANHYYELNPFGSQPDEEISDAGAARATPLANSTLRIDSHALDTFVNRVGEMVILRNTMSHQIQGSDLRTRQRQMQSLLTRRSASQPLSDDELASLRSLLADMDQRESQLAQTDQRVQTTLERMQEDALSLRVVPIGMVFNRLPRVAREVSQALDKNVKLVMSGEDVRIDKSLLEILIEPLMHMVRNAVDHGIESPADRLASGKSETATLSLTARQQGNTLLIDVQDDGRGLDRDRILARARKANLVDASRESLLSERDVFALIFQPGFSTSDVITEVSGRGVGMDVVKTRVTQVGGQVEVHSDSGRGTRFTLKLPLSAAIQNVVLVAAGEQRVAIPERNVNEVISLPTSRLQSVQGQACIRLRDQSLPVYRLDALLGHRPSVDHPSETLEIAVLSDGVYRIGLIVDQVIGRPEIFVRDVHPGITSLAGVGGVSVLGDGSLVIIADCENLFDLALRNAQSLNSMVRMQ